MADKNYGKSKMESPCKNVCLIHPDNKLCIGCFRSITEIANWSKYTHSQKSKINSELNERASVFKNKRKGGRKRRLKINI